MTGKMKKIVSPFASLAIALVMLFGLTATAEALVKSCGITSQSNAHTTARIVADAGNTIYITAIHGSTYATNGPWVSSNLSVTAKHPGGSTVHGYQGGCATVAQCK